MKRLFLVHFASGRKHSISLFRGSLNNEYALNIMEASDNSLLSAPNPVVVLSYPSFLLVSGNPAATRFFQAVSETFLAGESAWPELLHESDKAKVTNLLELCVSQEAQWADFRVRLGHQIRWLRANFVCLPKSDDTYIVCVLTDVSDLKQVGVVLTETQKELNHILTVNPAVIYRCEPSGEFPATFISNNVVSQLGYRPEDFTSNPQFWAGNIHPDDREQVFANLGQLFEHGHHAHEYRFRHANGEYHWMYDELRLIKDESGQPMDIVGNWIDISERKLEQLEKQRLEQEIQQARKMQAVGTLAGGVAHEFNNMLGIIMGYTELVQHELAQADPNRERLKYVLDASARAKKLISQLMSFSRKTHIRRVALNAGEIVAESLALLEATVPPSVSIVKVFSPDSGSILADATETKQVIINLVNNAMHAMDNRGVINVGLEKVRLSEERVGAFGKLKPGDYVKISVSDTGSGMSEEVAERVFEPFFTTKEVGKGTGMGLAMVYGIITDSGGVIEVDTALGEGTTFSLYFPNVEPTASREDGAVVEAGKVGAARILYVDDEPMYADVGKSTLQSLGYDVEAVTSGDEALEKFSEQPQGYDLLITDLLMPGMSGEELIEQVLALRADLPVVLLTGNRSFLSSDAQKRLPISEIVSKPLSREELAAIVARNIIQ